MRDLNYAIKKVCDRHRGADQSQSARANRARMLDQAATQIYQAGYKDVKAVTDMKPKHIHVLVAKWQTDGLDSGTIKNRMSSLRWLADKTEMHRLVKPTNQAYGIENRVYVTNEDKSVRFELDKINAIPNPYVRMAALLQLYFGLRREEAMKFQPIYADRGDHIVLKASWCKGSREREIPIRNEAQRQALDRAHEVAKQGSLIPSNLMYKQQIGTFERAMASVGLSKTHGARHAYAQERYRELTGRDCPAKGGKVAKELSYEEKSIDHAARKTISQELGHERESVTAIYLGR